MKRTTTAAYADSNTLAHYFWGVVTNPKLMVMCFSLSQLVALAKVMH